MEKEEGKMNKTVCDICGQDMAYRTGYEIRARGMQGECNRHMCEECFTILVLRKEGRHDTVETH